jgi:hypothetical protein
VDSGRLARDRKAPRLIVVARREDLLRMRRASICKALRYYQANLRWARATEWASVALTGWGAWMTLDGRTQVGALTVLGGTLAAMVCRSLQGRLRDAQREAYWLLEGHGA